MRPQKVDDEALMEKMIPLFRSKGYDGTSMQDISEATGLKKASLYHRFPGGKEDMVNAVIAYASIQVKETIIGVLINSTLPKDKKIDKVLKGIKNYYDGGKASCMLRTLSMGSSLQLFGEKLEVGMARWIEAFALFGQEIGYTEEDANRLATETLVMVQGSLVVSNTLGSTAPFLEALEKIRSLYTD